jgi:hypothetical protein
MDRLFQVIDALRANPILAVGLAVGLIVGYRILQRRPSMQRDADEQLSALRRDKADQYTKLRPPR